MKQQVGDTIMLLMKKDSKIDRVELVITNSHADRIIKRKNRSYFPIRTLLTEKAYSNLNSRITARSVYRTKNRKELEILIKDREKYYFTSYPYYRRWAVGR